MTEYIPLVENEVENKNEYTMNVNIDSDFHSKPLDIRNSFFRKRNKTKYIILIISYIFWFIFYKAALIGGDLEWIKNHLFLIGVLLFTSFISYSINLWTIAFMRIQKRKKIIFYLFDILSVLGFLLYDHGELFDFHGMYNFLLFCLFIITIDGLAIALYVWYRAAGKRKFRIQLLSFISILIIILFFSLKHYMKLWNYGFLNKRIEDGDGLCKVRKPIPWFDLLPRGAQNFWTGSQSCSRDELFKASFDSSQDNKLVVTGCKEEKVTYMILPDTRNLTFIEKQEDILRESVLKKMESKIYDYTGPVDLNDIEAVYVTCGEQNKLVTRLAGRRVEPTEKEQPDDQLNVLLIYIDAVARRQFFRNLPKTVKKLESLNNDGIMHLNQFFRYGVIGFNTNRNSLGLFAGLQLKRGEKGVPIWEDYRNSGYVAGAADDHCEDWDTTYNNRTAISLDHELLAPFCLPEYHERTGNPHGNFKGAYSIRRRCITGDYVHNYVLRYTKEFINTYDGTNPWFFRSSFIEGHEGTGEVLSLMDDDLVDFFDSLSEETLNRTAILIMSDHGLHMGLSFLFADQGRTEHKLPFFTTLIPERFLNKYPQLRKNLDGNEQKLISAYDIYATLRDMLNFDLDREPMEKTGVGKDILDAKLNRRKFGKRNELHEWLEEMDKYNRRNRMFEEDIRHKHYKRDKVIYGPATKNGTIIWGKSVLREIPNRKCEQILIHSGDCVCN